MWVSLTFGKKTAHPLHPCGIHINLKNILNAIAMSKDDYAPRIWISEFALERMRQLAQSHFPLETGGMLIGYVGDNSEPVVNNVIGPGPKARHGRFRFV